MHIDNGGFQVMVVDESLDGGKQMIEGSGCTQLFREEIVSARFSGSGASYCSNNAIPCDFRVEMYESGTKCGAGFFSPPVCLIPLFYHSVR
jgi:hypothetical protein